MRKSFVPTALAVATSAMLALTSAAEAGGGRYFGGGGHAGGSHWSGGHAGASHWNVTYGGGRHWHGGHRHSSWGWYGWGWPAAALGASVALAATWPYWTGAYYYDAPRVTHVYPPATYAYPPTTYVYPQATVVAPNATAVEPAPGAYSYRLFCPATNAYYPDVLDCAPYFVKVNPDADRAKSAPPATAPETPAPAPRSSVPQSYAPAARPYVPDANAGLATQAAYRNSASAQVAAYSPSRVIPAPKRLGPGIALVAPAQAQIALAE